MRVYGVEEIKQRLAEVRKEVVQRYADMSLTVVIVIMVTIVPYHVIPGFLANVNSRSRSLYAIARSSVVCRLSVVCNVRAPYSGG